MKSRAWTLSRLANLAGSVSAVLAIFLVAAQAGCRGTAQAPLPAVCDAECSSSCADGSCEAPADPAGCGELCTGEPSCGDGKCELEENCRTCADDCGLCPTTCGNGTCDADENCASCEADCGPCPAFCGDGRCDPGAGEICTSCAADCKTTAQVCGNGACQAGETAENCRADCGPSPWPDLWKGYEEEVVRLINENRQAGTDCPTGPREPAPALASDAALRRAAQLHAWDQSFERYFSHTSCNGRSPWQRAAEQGTSASGETIGAGHRAPADMVNSWLASAGHCAILMNPSYRAVGVGYAAESGSYWVAMFR